MKIIRKQNRSKKIVLYALTCLFVILSAFAAYKLLQKYDPADNQVGNKPLEINDVDYSGLTENEIEHSQDAKKSSTEDGQKQNDTNGSKNNVGVAISYADITNDHLEMRAFATGVIQGNSTCTATVTNSDIALTAQSAAFIDASTTICEPMYINKDQLAPGSWVVTVKFDSPNAIGESSRVTVEVK